MRKRKLFVPQIDKDGIASIFDDAACDFLIERAQEIMGGRAVQNQDGVFFLGHRNSLLNERARNHNTALSLHARQQQFLDLSGVDHGRERFLPCALCTGAAVFRGAGFKEISMFGGIHHFIHPRQRILLDEIDRLQIQLG